MPRFLLRIDLSCRPRRRFHMADRTGGSPTPVEEGRVKIWRG
jgi:hypothetical protein